MNDSDRRLLTEALSLKWFDYPEGNITFSGIILHNLEFNCESERKVLLGKGSEQQWWSEFYKTLSKEGSVKDLFHSTKFPNLIVEFLKNGKNTQNVTNI
jgi:hypothetical protein